MTPLCLATLYSNNKSNGWVEHMKLLLKAGADVHGRFPDTGMAPLHYASNTEAGPGNCSVAPFLDLVITAIPGLVIIAIPDGRRKLRSKELNSAGGWETRSRFG